MIINSINEEKIISFLENPKILKTKWKINKSQKMISLTENKKIKGLYSLSEIQVNAILELRLQKLTAFC